MYRAEDKKEAVKEVQYKLNMITEDKDAPLLPIDGIYGSDTKLAMEKFNERHGLGCGCDCDLRSFDALNEAYTQKNLPSYPTLTVGSQGEDVAALHLELERFARCDNEFPAVPRSTYYSEETERCVRRARHDLFMPEDGGADALFHDRLIRDLKVPD